MSQITGPIKLAYVLNPTSTAGPTAPGDVVEREDVTNTKNGRRWHKLGVLGGSALIELGVDRAFDDRPTFTSPLTITADDCPHQLIGAAGTIRLADALDGREVTVVFYGSGSLVIASPDGLTTYDTLLGGESGSYLLHPGTVGAGQPNWRRIGGEVVITAAAKSVLDDVSVAAMVNTLGGAASSGSGGLARLTSPTFEGVAQFAIGGIAMPDSGDNFTGTIGFESLSNNYDFRISMSSGDATLSMRGGENSFANSTFPNTGFAIEDTGGDHVLFLKPGENLSANRILTISVGDANRTLTVAANATVSNTNTGDQTITLTGAVTGSGTGSFATTLAASIQTDIDARPKLGLALALANGNF